MRFAIEVYYDADKGEDVGSVARVLAADLAQLDGVERVVVHGEESTVIGHPDYEPVVVES